MNPLPGHLNHRCHKTDISSIGEYFSLLVLQILSTYFPIQIDIHGFDMRRIELFTIPKAI
jgi:hypothetical protein